MVIPQRIINPYCDIEETDVVLQEELIGISTNEELKKRALWSLAKIIQLIPGKDGHVRVVRVKTETGELVRRLYNLEVQEP
ncbi:hypothetical protein TNCV_914471 [Trichonephila clavipes]|nr:hypothetical protein TNCV_914471 [Trichonephila clavipes]